MTLNSKTPFTVGFLLIDGFALMSYAAALEPLRAANMLGARDLASKSDGPLYKWCNISAVDDHATSSSGAIIKADARVGDDLDLDVLFVVAGGDPFECNDPSVLGWLRKLASRGAVLGGISGGPVILARAGLMSGRRMTVHWEHAEKLLDHVPDVILSRTLFVIDRDRLTCAGGVAPLDIMHGLIAERYGPDFARLVSDWFLHTEIRPPGGPQKAGIIERYGVTDRFIVMAIEVMQNHIGDPLKLADIAHRVQCTGRHLNRLFDAELETSVMAFYRVLRLEHGRILLRQSSLSITEIALDVGFSDSAHFSSAYRRHYAMSPKETRNAV